jgi:hypothetical protein
MDFVGPSLIWSYIFTVVGIGLDFFTGQWFDSALKSNRNTLRVPFHEAFGYHFTFHFFPSLLLTCWNNHEEVIILQPARRRKMAVSGGRISQRTRASGICEDCRNYLLKREPAETRDQVELADAATEQL